MNSAILALEDGTVFEGRSFGAPTERSGEVVFNTALTGYQEVFTDPSYSGQIVILTNPQIGNYGTNVEDNESTRPYIEGLAVREFSAMASNWRSDAEANTFLKRHDIPVISDLDTRGLVRHLRTRGVMRGVLSSVETQPQKLIEKARAIPTMAGLDLASRVSTPERYTWTKPVEPCSPSEFIAAAERSGLMKELESWVIRETLLQGAVWRTDGVRIGISVNIGAPLLHDEPFLRLFERTLKIQGAPTSFTFEVAAASLGATERPTEGLTRLRERGVRLALDDVTDLAGLEAASWFRW